MIHRCRDIIAVLLARFSRLACLAFALPSVALGQPEVHPLQFVIGDFANERQVPVALLTNLRIDGRPCSVQIDTGVGRAFTVHQPSDGPATSSIDVELGSLKVTYPTPESTKRRLAECRLGEPVASLGNAFFDQRTVVLDFAARSLSVHEAATLQDDPRAQPFRYAKWWGQDGGVILVQVLGTRQLASEAMLDTGALRVDLGVLDPATWDALADSASSVSTAFSVPSWGRQLQCSKIAARWPLMVSTLQAAKPMLTHCPGLGFKPAEPILAILGMRQFLNSGVVIDFQSLRWRAL